LLSLAYPGWMDKSVGRNFGYCLDMGYLPIFLLFSAAPTAFEYGRVG
jgi:hypothetical protein